MASGARTSQCSPDCMRLGIDQWHFEECHNSSLMPAWCERDMIFSFRNYIWAESKLHCCHFCRIAVTSLIEVSLCHHKDLLSYPDFKGPCTVRLQDRCQGESVGILKPLLILHLVTMLGEIRTTHQDSTSQRECFWCHSTGRGCPADVWRVEICNGVTGQCSIWAAKLTSMVRK